MNDIYKVSITWKDPKVGVCTRFDGHINVPDIDKWTTRQGTFAIVNRDEQRIHVYIPPEVI